MAPLLAMMRSWSSQSLRSTVDGGARLEPVNRAELRAIAGKVADVLEDRGSGVLDMAGRGCDCAMMLVVNFVMAVWLLLGCFFSCVCLLPASALCLEECLSCVARHGSKIPGAIEWLHMVLMPRTGARYRRLRRLSDRAGRLSDRDEEKHVVIYLIPVGRLRAWNAWPSHDAVFDILEPCPVSLCLAEKRILFVSHKYVGTDPDPGGQVLEAVKARSGDFTHVFFDYTCVPDDAALRMQHLRIVYLYQGLGKVIAFRGDDEARRVAFRNSVWCTLETILDVDGELPDRQFTMQQPDDLYDLLPGFLSLLCAMPGMRMVLLSTKWGRAVAKPLAGILRFFAQHHDRAAASASASAAASASAEISLV